MDVLEVFPLLQRFRSFRPGQNVTKYLPYTLNKQCLLLLFLPDSATLPCTKAF